jgi:CRP/FNR family cyclic AMP-dependent transcriptional regulator
MSTQEQASGTPAVRRTLAGIGLLQSLGADERAALEQKCAWRRYRPGERVIERGSPGEEVIFVVEGAVNVVSFSAMGREITFATVAAGASVGELAAIDGSARSASVVALEDSLLAALPASDFVALLKREGEVSFRLLQFLAGLVRKGTERVIELSSIKSTNRVYAELLRLAEPDPAAPDLWVVRPLPPLRELAGRASATRELVTHALNQLYPSGLIRRRGSDLYIMDRKALEELVTAAEEAEET